MSLKDIKKIAEKYYISPASAAEETAYVSPFTVEQILKLISKYEKVIETLNKYENTALCLNDGDTFLAAKTLKEVGER